MLRWKQRVIFSTTEQGWYIFYVLVVLNWKLVMESKGGFSMNGSLIFNAIIPYVCTGRKVITEETDPQFFNVSKFKGKKKAFMPFE